MAVEARAAKRRKPLPDNPRPGAGQAWRIGPSRLTAWSAQAGLLGGLLWVLFPLAELPAANLMLTPQGYVAVYALGYLWAQLLLLVGLKGFHDRHNYAYGWPGTVGFYAIFVALALAFTGGAILITSLTFAGAESLVAYLTLIVSFVPLGLGSALLGLAITGVMRDPLSQLAGLLLTIGVPLGLLVAFAAGANADFSFWAGLTMPYGLAWMLLGVPLASERYGG